MKRTFKGIQFENVAGAWVYSYRSHEGKKIYCVIKPNGKFYELTMTAGKNDDQYKGRYSRMYFAVNAIKFLSAPTYLTIYSRAVK